MPRVAPPPAPRYALPHIPTNTYNALQPVGVPQTAPYGGQTTKPADTVPADTMLADTMLADTNNALQPVGVPQTTPYDGQTTKPADTVPADTMLADMRRLDRQRTARRSPHSLSATALALLVRSRTQLTSEDDLQNYFHHASRTAVGPNLGMILPSLDEAVARCDTMGYACAGFLLEKGTGSSAYIIGRGYGLKPSGSFDFYRKRTDVHSVVWSSFAGREPRLDHLLPLTTCYSVLLATTTTHPTC